MTLRLLLLAAALLAGAPTAAVQPAAATYEVYAVRFCTIPAFQVSGLVARADPCRRLDIPPRPEPIVAGHDPAIFDRFATVPEGVVRIR